MAEKRDWLMKSEPEVVSIDDLQKKKTALWDSVRNYQARNFMMNDMKKGDLILFYHSSTEPPGIAGIAKVAGPAEADPTQFDKKSEYYDPKSKKEDPTWKCVPVEFVEKFSKFVPLEDIRGNKKLATMLVIKRGMRLSIQPVTAA
ncbi:MAG: EVE domain-containing protein, partial [Pseudobdellovibrionaceae bacterium]